jgi:50S ribosome-binding GTPase
MSTPAVALIGLIGHGKTYLLNKLTGKSFLSEAGHGRCTLKLQGARSIDKSLLILDTTGLNVSPGHLVNDIVAIKYTLEDMKLAGIYIVVKYDGGVDRVANVVAAIATHLDVEDVRIIITHYDVFEEGHYAVFETMKNRLHDIVGVRKRNILVTGRDDSYTLVQKFISATLYKPKEIELSKDHRESFVQRFVNEQAYKETLDDIKKRLQMDQEDCQKVFKRFGRCLETDDSIVRSQDTAKEYIESVRTLINLLISQQRTDDDRFILDGRANLMIAVGLKSFLETTDKILSKCRSKSGSQYTYKILVGPWIYVVRSSVEGVSFVLCWITKKAQSLVYWVIRKLKYLWDLFEARDPVSVSMPV